MITNDETKLVNEGEVEYNFTITDATELTHEQILALPEVVAERVFIEKEGWKVVVEINGKLYVLLSELKKQKQMGLLESFVAWAQANEFSDSDGVVHYLNGRVTINGNNQQRTLFPFVAMTDYYGLPRDLWTIRWRLDNLNAEVKSGTCKDNLDGEDKLPNEGTHRNNFVQGLLGF